MGELNLKVPGFWSCWLLKAVPSRTPPPFVVPVAGQQFVLASALCAAMQ